MTMKTFKIAALAIAAPGLAMAMPAQAAVPTATHQAVHAATYEIESSNQWRDRYRDRRYRDDRDDHRHWYAR